jgi:hypothetical protein
MPLTPPEAHIIIHQIKAGTPTYNDNRKPTKSQKLTHLHTKKRKKYTEYPPTVTKKMG